MLVKGVTATWQINIDISLFYHDSPSYTILFNIFQIPKIFQIVRNYQTWPCWILSHVLVHSTGHCLTNAKCIAWPMAHGSAVDLQCFSKLWSASLWWARNLVTERIWWLGKPLLMILMTIWCAWKTNKFLYICSALRKFYPLCKLLLFSVTPFWLVSWGMSPHRTLLLTRVHCKHKRHQQKGMIWWRGCQWGIVYALNSWNYINNININLYAWGTADRDCGLCNLVD